MPMPRASSEGRAPAATAGPALDQLRVLLPLPLAEALDYRVPDGMTPPAAGSFVRVPLGGRTLVGVVWDGEGPQHPRGFAPDRLRPIGEALPLPPLPSALRRFVARCRLHDGAARGGAAHGDERRGSIAAAASASPVRAVRRRAVGAERVDRRAALDPGPKAGARNTARPGAAGDRDGAARRLQCRDGARAARPRPHRGAACHPRTGGAVGTRLASARRLAVGRAAGGGGGD